MAPDVKRERQEASRADDIGPPAWRFVNLWRLYLGKLTDGYVGTFISDSDRQPDLGLLVRQQRQLLTELGGLRDDVNVLTSIVLRQDGTLNALLTELRAMHSQHGRLANRVQALEAGTMPAG